MARLPCIQDVQNEYQLMASQLVAAGRSSEVRR
jgi:hypothetical protein